VIIGSAKCTIRTRVRRKRGTRRTSTAVPVGDPGGDGGPLSHSSSSEDSSSSSRRHGGSDGLLRGRHGHRFSGRFFPLCSSWWRSLSLRDGGRGGGGERRAGTPPHRRRRSSASDTRRGRSPPSNSARWLLSSIGASPRSRPSPTRNVSSRRWRRARYAQGSEISPVVAGSPPHW
jgi:hypothetical protein